MNGIPSSNYPNQNVYEELTSTPLFNMTYNQALLPTSIASVTVENFVSTWIAIIVTIQLIASHIISDEKSRFLVF